MTFKHHYNSKPDKGEVNNVPSLTIPDQTMSLREILRRYAAGYPVEGQKEPQYLGEEDDMPDIKKMDLSEIEDYANEYKKHIEIFDNVKKTAAEKKAAKLREKEIDLEIKRRQKELDDKSTNTP